MSSLEAENRQLREEVQQLRDELEHKNNKILSLEAELKSLNLRNGSTNNHTNNDDEDDRPGFGRKPSMGIGRKPSIGIPVQATTGSSSLSMPRRAAEDSTGPDHGRPPIPPAPEPPSSSGGQRPGAEYSSDNFRSLGRTATPLPTSGGMGLGKPPPRATVFGGLGGAIEEEDEEDIAGEAPSPAQGIRKSNPAIKALPRELSIFNSDDDDITKASEDGMPTYEVDNMEMRDAYNARGIYTGTVAKANQLPHGKGKMKYHHAGRSYEGDWEVGHWHGQGTITNAIGDVYVGKVVNDLKDGEGKLMFSDGRVFEGRFIEDEMVEGTMTFLDNSKYVGQLLDQKRHGYGTYYFADGSKYEGNSVDNAFEGMGKITWNDGGWYNGEWRQGQIHGFGMEVRPDGSVRHKGKWENGQPIRRR